MVLNGYVAVVCASFCAEDKTATSSSYEKDDPQFAPGKAVDGYTQTRWSSNFFTDKAPDEAWWRVDLGAKAPIQFIVINFEAACGKEFDILVSDDGKSWKKVLEVKYGKPGENIYKLPASAEGRCVKYRESSEDLRTDIPSLNSGSIPAGRRMNIAKGAG